MKRFKTQKQLKKDNNGDKNSGTHSHPNHHLTPQAPQHLQPSTLTYPSALSLNLKTLILKNYKNVKYFYS